MNNRLTFDGLQPNRLRHHKRKPRSAFWKITNTDIKLSRIDNIQHRERIWQDMGRKESNKRMTQWIAEEENKTKDSEHNQFTNQMYL